MATFKMGQRVKLARCSPGFERNIGATGVIAALGITWCNHPGAIVNWDDGAHGYWERLMYLEPLTDPAADAFVESIKKMKPYEEPKTAFVAQLDAIHEEEERAGETE